MTQQQMQLALFDDAPTVEGLLHRRENQWFERKSARIEPHNLANDMIAFANADGGRIAIGIHGGEIEGVDSSPGRVNDFQQAALDFTSPPVRHTCRLLECTNSRGHSDHILVLDVEASEAIHRNRKQECFLRVGDENRRLGVTQERELAFDKGEATFDGTVVPGLVREDIDMGQVEMYRESVGASSAETLLRSRGLYLDYAHRKGVTQAGWLLFGLNPPVWSYVRYIRYDGTVAETGIRSNVLEDVRLEGTIPSLIEQARLLLIEKIGTVIRLTQSGRFERVPTVPEFVWLEAIVNAVTHRSYSLQGDGIRVREFDDRLEIESPGRLPGLVRVQNIQNIRFSRNPHIARVLAELTGHVRELNEGVRRMFEEMERSGLRAPAFSVGEGSVRVTLFKKPEGLHAGREQEVADVLARLRKRVGDSTIKLLLATLKRNERLRPGEIAGILGVTLATARRYMRILEESGLVRLVSRSRTDPTATWAITDSPFWKRMP